MAMASRVFRALADPTRRQILQDLKEGELPAGEIASRFSISGPSISRHLSILKAADLIAERRVGNNIYYRLEAQGIATVLGDFLSKVCPTEVLHRRRARMEEAS